MPSGGILKSNKRKSNGSVETKDTGTEAKSSLTSSVQLNDAEKKPQTTVGFTSEWQASDTGRRKIGSPTILIGRERSDKPETGDGRKKVRYRLQDMIRHRCTYHRKSDKGSSISTFELKQKLFTVVWNYCYFKAFRLSIK